MKSRAITLSDRYLKLDGEVLLTGIQALVRLPLDQRRRDAQAGIHSAGFISGYRGSPLGGYDQELMRAKKYLEPQNIVFTPGINEELGATAVWGSQQTELFPGAKFDGTFGLWYGKAPGVDRAGDVFRHANHAGSSAKGGVVALCGDDHDCKSSTLPSQSEYALMHAEMPVLNPASVQDVLDFGHLGIALSRASGLWVGMIALADTMDSAALVNVSAARLQILQPDMAKPVEGLHIRLGDTPIMQEERLRRFKLPAALEFARVNGLNRLVVDSADARLGLVATGRAYEDLMQALALLGVDEQRASQLGLRILKVGMSWPLDAALMRGFARGLQNLLVVESKRPLMEDQLRTLLYDLPSSERPAILGKRDAEGRPLLSDTRALTAAQIARALMALLPDAALQRRGSEYLGALESQEQLIKDLPALAARTPFYCAGCPHNRSTQLPEGSRGMAGIGCHYMVTWMDRDTHLFSQMGGEGVHWMGQQPFTSHPHMFVNLGDGTYFHSGILAIRQAVGAKLNITYKILYNDAVAMTGGQAVDGVLTPQRIAQQVLAEGVSRAIVVADDVSRYDDAEALPNSVDLRGRDKLDATQQELREISGVTVLIYDQVCAAEKRRRRKRKLMSEPKKRLFINDAVCEGCGDCSVKSNCIAVEPLETPLGRKRQINQSSCNKDYSCAEGFCPSFVEVLEADLRKDAALMPDAATLPEPIFPELKAPYQIFITGIGGTGITTVASILSHAAFMAGLEATELNMTGLAQKGGAVTSHIRLAPAETTLHGPRIAATETDLLLAADLMVAVTPDALKLLRPSRACAVVNADLAPTAAFVRNKDVQYDGAAMLAVLARATKKQHVLDASKIAQAALGDTLYGNMLQLGYAYQLALVPIAAEKIMAAIELNGTAVAENQAAFQLGRQLAINPDLAKEILPKLSPTANIVESLPDLLAHRAAHLTAYQSKDYAKKYLDFVAEVQQAEEKLRADLDLTRIVAEQAARLMAYKDEYEVARLYSRSEFKQKLHANFSRTGKLRVLLAPPLISRKDKLTGHLQKRAFGAWIFSVFNILQHGRLLRGTFLDVCGMTAERRMERQLIQTYMADMRRALRGLRAENYSQVMELAKWPAGILGFGHVKERNAKAAEALRAKSLQALNCTTADHLAQAAE